MNQIKEIRVIAFLTNDVKDYQGPVPDNYLSKDENIPKQLVDELKKNGWKDSNNVLCWGKDFQPEPVLGEDGNVYLCLSDEDMKNPIRTFDRMSRSKKMIQSN
jgi:hypothetical protein